MACDNCLDNEFYQDKAEHYLQTYGIPINVSKQILKILYTSLDSCGLDCCDNIYSGQLALMQFQNEGTNLTQSSNVGIMNFVGAGVTASISGNVLTISISGGGGSSGLANGNYGDITVSNGTLTWTINNGVISTAKLADGAVTNNKLAVNSVTDTKIQNGAVSNAKLANNSVSNSKIQDGSITANKLAQMGATVGQVLKWNGSAWIASDDLTLGGGAVTQGANVGSGQGEIYRDTTGNTINFKKLNAAGNISIINNTDDITISTTSVGEANTASNLGVSGKSIFAQKVGVDLQLRRLVAGTNIVLTENANDITIDATTSGGGGSGSPVDAPYVTLGLSSGLSNERVLTQGVGITIVDGGANGLVTINATSGVGTGWALVGNSGTVAGTNFIGTTDDVDVVFKRNNVIAGRVSTNGGEGAVTLGVNTPSSGSNITAIGHQSLKNYKSGNHQIAIGPSALGTVLAVSVTSIVTGYWYKIITVGGFDWTLIGATSNTVGVEFLATDDGPIIGIGGVCVMLSTGSSNIAIGASSQIGNGKGDRNVSIGTGTLSKNVSGSRGVAIGDSSQEHANDSTIPWINTNVSIGWESLRGSTTAADNIGLNNTAIGYATLHINTTGSGNTAVGFESLYTNTEGNSNTAIGEHALYNNTTGYENTAIGTSTLINNTTGWSNTAIGAEALYSNTTGRSNIAIGRDALKDNVSGKENTAVGIVTLTNNTTGEYNNAIGSTALVANTTGTHNNAFGVSSIWSNTTGSDNIAMGSSSLRYNTTGNNNVALGRDALFSNTTVSNLVAVGYQTLYSNTTGNFNTALGYKALKDNTVGSHNTANGYETLTQNTTGNYNTATGFQALFSNSVGIENTANGYSALVVNETGNGNTANGYDALRSNTTGNYNTANGYSALVVNTTGNGNTANGSGALYNNTIGISNTANGGNALFSNTTGSYNTALGREADVSTSAQTYSTVIGANAIVSTNNTIKLGRSTQDSVVIGQDGAVSSAKLAVASTTQGFLPPVMTTANRDSISSPTRGLMIYDSSVDKVSVYNGTIWKYLAYE